ncbi:MotB family protein [Mesorhizobium sp. SP-1A]|uniref:MotB family protein n=1 Tax=Mesorhizobium sp. SP-1A TaxID=3077840 RepID=UPI0028F70291|nr:MotB family protein [Mesorhizobium sp. SP-1A]
MSVAEGESHRQEIIIVRRGGHDHEEDHHGGVWKIAFADFMTAMMCFFLVMWLINAANDQTKNAVASYFNPIKLTDRNSSRKGLNDAGNDPSQSEASAGGPQEKSTDAGHKGKGGEAAKAEQKDQKTKSAENAGSADQKLFADPYAVLAEIAADTGVMQNISARGDGGAQKSGPATGASGGESYRDPFAPDFWSQQMAAPLADASAERPKVEGVPATPGDKTAEADAPPVKEVARQTPDTAPVLKEAPLEPLAKDAKAAPGAAPEKPAAAARQAETAKASEAGNTPDAAALKATAEVKAEIAKAFKADDKMAKGISVEATDKGVSISITDQLDFGMFEIGSAVPSRELVLAMDKVGRIVNGQKGKITIKGHTDARPFRSATYDNWRLSTARAHAAYYMLVRGGVDEHRISEVAGLADRQPKDAADPLSAVNRRIEILLETGG